MCFIHLGLYNLPYSSIWNKFTYVANSETCVQSDLVSYYSSEILLKCVLEGIYTSTFHYQIKHLISKNACCVQMYFIYLLSRIFGACLYLRSPFTLIVWPTVNADRILVTL